MVWRFDGLEGGGHDDVRVYYSSLGGELSGDETNCCGVVCALLCGLGVVKKKTNGEGPGPRFYGETGKQQFGCSNTHTPACFSSSSFFRLFFSFALLSQSPLSQSLCASSDTKRKEKAAGVAAG